MALGSVTPYNTSDRYQLVSVWFEEYQAALFRYLLRLLNDQEWVWICCKIPCRIERIYYKIPGCTDFFDDDGVDVSASAEV